MVLSRSSGAGGRIEEVSTGGRETCGSRQRIISAPSLPRLEVRRKRMDGRRFKGGGGREGGGEGGGRVNDVYR